MELKKRKILVLGDSITEGCGLSDPDEQAFWRLLAIRDGAEVKGYGIGGTRIARQRIPSVESKYDRYFSSRVPEMDPGADIVIVFGGTNDYGHGDAPLGMMSDRTEDTFFGALHCLYQSLLEKYPNALIVVLTPLHREKEEQLINEIGIRNVGTLADYVDIIRRVAAYYSLPVLDLYRYSGIQPNETGLRERYAPDGLHPNEAGHEKIYNLLKSFLETL